MINRLDKNGKLITVDDVIFNSSNGKHYTVVFSNDILAFGIMDDTGFFDFMTDWVADEWEVVGCVKR